MEKSHRGTSSDAVAAGGRLHEPFGGWRKFLSRLSDPVKARVVTEEGIALYQLALVKRGEYDRVAEVRRYFEVALRFDPGNRQAQAYLELVDKYRETETRKRLREAEALLKKGKRSQEEDYALCLAVTRAGQLAPEDDEVAALLRQTEELRGTLVTFYLERGREVRSKARAESGAEAREKLYLEAFRSFNRVLAVEPQNPSARTEQASLAAAVNEILEERLEGARQLAAKGKYAEARKEGALLEELNRRLGHPLDAEVGELNYSLNYRWARSLLERRDYPAALARADAALAVRKTEEATALRRRILEARKLSASGVSYEAALDEVDRLFAGGDLAGAYRRIDELAGATKDRARLNALETRKEKIRAQLPSPVREGRGLLPGGGVPEGRRAAGDGGGDRRGVRAGRRVPGQGQDQAEAAGAVRGRRVSRERGQRILLHALEALYSLALLAWAALPLLPFLADFAGLLQLPDLLRLPSGLFAPGSMELAVATVLVYLMAAIRLYKLACLALDPVLAPLADPRRSFPILISLASSGLALAAILVPIVRQAASWRYFTGLPPALIALFFLSLLHNAYFLALLIARLNRKDEAYRDYLEFQRGAGRGFLRALLARGIQKRLVFSFTALILLIVGVLSLVLMRNFSRTLLAALIENGKGLAERTASVIRANFGDDIALDDYFRIEARKNAEAVFRFDELTYYRRGAADGEFRVAASTASAWIGESLQGPALGLERTGYRFDPQLELYEFRAPVLVRSILIGFVHLAYARHVIYEPYFRAQLQVVPDRGYRSCTSPCSWCTWSAGTSSSPSCSSV